MELEADCQLRKGLWTAEEDRALIDYIRVHGKGRWNRIAKLTGLKRSGKSCRLRWMNYLSPGVKRDIFSEEEDDLIIRLHNLLGNRWSLIAGRVPGRTDNQVKNHWNTQLSKKLGIKKAKTKAQNSSKTQYSKAVAESFRASVPQNLPHSEAPSPNGSAPNQRLVKDGLVGYLDTLDLTMDDKSCQQSSLWFYEDNLNLDMDMEMESPSLLELFGQHCPEFAWNGL